LRQVIYAQHFDLIADCDPLQPLQHLIVAAIIALTAINVQVIHLGLKTGVRT